MRSIEDIRNALGHFPNGRFEIGTRSPVHRPRVQATTTTTIDSSVPWVGVELDASEIANTAQQSPTSRKEELFKGLDAAVEAGGMEALAWYVSFHNQSSAWGIYIPLSSVHYIADRVLAHVRLPEHRRFQVALQLLLQHERFHFAADFAQTQVELLLGESCRYWLKNQFQPGKYLEIEEAMANAWMLRQVGADLTSRQYEAVEAFVRRQPPGYREALPYVNDEVRYQIGLGEVVKSYAGVIALSRNPVLPVGSVAWETYFARPGELDWNQCPVHLLHNDLSAGLPPLAPKLLTCLPDIRETRKFLKRLRSLATYLQKVWAETKQELERRAPQPKQFEALSGKFKGLYSVRLNQSHRVHLRPIDGFEVWEAINVGTHTEMGHD